MCVVSTKNNNDYYAFWQSANKKIDKWLLK